MNPVRNKHRSETSGKIHPRKIHKTQIKDGSVFIRRMFSDFQALELDHFA